MQCLPYAGFFLSTYLTNAPFLNIAEVVLPVMCFDILNLIAIAIRVGLSLHTSTLWNDALLGHGSGHLITEYGNSEQRHYWNQSKVTQGVLKKSYIYRNKFVGIKRHFCSGVAESRG